MRLAHVVKGESGYGIVFGRYVGHVWPDKINADWECNTLNEEIMAMMRAAQSQERENVGKGTVCPQE